MENKPKIMIVDDAEMNRQLLMSILGEEYTYIEAEDGNQALHLLQKDLSIDLMLLEEFDRGIFESIIEKVIVGGYDENGEKDPYRIIFIYKTGFRNEIGNAKERFGKKIKAELTGSSVVETEKALSSHISDEVKDVCSYNSDDTCGDGSAIGKGKIILRQCGM